MAPDKTIMQIGVLDIQGSVEEHGEALARAGAQVVMVKKLEDLRRVDGLIIPGGESTTIGKLLERFGLGEEIINRAKEGMPIWGTCAGAILIAKKIIGKQSADKLNLMDITVERNAYGRQLESMETELEWGVAKEIGAEQKGHTSTAAGTSSSAKNTAQKASTKIPAVFIRAPRITEIGENVQVLATYEGDIVAARQGTLLATTFHPEMTKDTTVHRYFMDMCRESL